MSEQKLNISINEGDAFFAHELSINYSPTQFLLDFKCVTPRTDPRSEGSPVLNIKHNVIMIEAHHAKQIAELLNRVVLNYEKDFGEIKKPVAIETAEKRQHKTELLETTKPTYFG